MCEFSYNFEKINVVVTESIKRLQQAKKEIVLQGIHNILNELNHHLPKPLIGFAIKGTTPEYNDGEICEHDFDYCVPHIDSDLMYDNPLDDEEIFKKFFGDILNKKYKCAYDYSKAVNSGNENPIIVYNNYNEKSLIEKAIYGINQLIELSEVTNYLVIGKYNNLTNNYDIDISYFAPDY